MSKTAPIFLSSAIRTCSPASACRPTSSSLNVVGEGWKGPGRAARHEGTRPQTGKACHKGSQLLHKGESRPRRFPGPRGVPSGMMLPAGCAARCYGSEGTTAPPCSPCHNADPSVALRRIRRDCPAPGCPYCQEGGLEKKRAGDAVKVRPARAVTPPWAHG